MDGDRLAEVFFDDQISYEKKVECVLELINRFNMLKSKYSEIVAERDLLKSKLEHMDDTILDQTIKKIAAIDLTDIQDRCEGEPDEEEGESLQKVPIKKEPISKKISCLKCSKLFLEKTLLKRKGYCYKCTRALSMEGPSLESLRFIVWNRYIGESVREGQCYTCSRIIKLDDYERAHLISRYNGGDDSVENLRPTCRDCNSVCGTENLDDFKKRIAVKQPGEP